MESRGARLGKRALHDRGKLDDRRLPGVGSGGFGRGLGGTAGIFGFADGGDAIDVEFLVIGVASDFVDLDGFYKQEASANVRFFVGGKPYFIVDIGLLEDEARSFLQIGDYAAAETEIADKIGFQARNVVSLLVDPDHAG